MIIMIPTRYRQQFRGGVVAGFCASTTQLIIAQNPVPVSEYTISSGVIPANKVMPNNRWIAPSVDDIKTLLRHNEFSHVLDPIIRLTKKYVGVVLHTRKVSVSKSKAVVVELYRSRSGNSVMYRKVRVFAVVPRGFVIPIMYVNLK